MRKYKQSKEKSQEGRKKKRESGGTMQCQIGKLAYASMKRRNMSKDLRRQKS